MLVPFHLLVIPQYIFNMITILRTAETADLFDRAPFAAMKSSMYFIYIFRPKIRNDDALLDAPRRGEITGAVPAAPGIERLPPESKFWRLSRWIITPYSGGITQYGEDACADGGTVTLALVADGTLSFDWVGISSEGGASTASGTLSRVDAGDESASGDRVSAPAQDSAATESSMSRNAVAPVDNIYALLPTNDDVPSELILIEERERALSEVAENYTDPEQTVALFTGWDWRRNVSRTFHIPDGAASNPDAVDGVYVSIHDSAALTPWQLPSIFRCRSRRLARTSRRSLLDRLESTPARSTEQCPPATRSPCLYSWIPFSSGCPRPPRRGTPHQWPSLSCR